MPERPPAPVNDGLVIRPKRDWRLPVLSEQAMLIAVVAAILLILLVIVVVTW